MDRDWKEIVDEQGGRSLVGEDLGFDVLAGTACDLRSRSATDNSLPRAERTGNKTALSLVIILVLQAFCGGPGSLVQIAKWCKETKVLSVE